MSTDPIDCPAAHSMDTIWFAVDADGNIGVFDTGEAGAVPTDAALGINPGGDGIDTFPLDALRAAHVLSRGESEIADAGRDVGLIEGDRVVVVIDRARLADTDTYRTSKLGPFETALRDSIWVLREDAPRIVASREPLDATALRALLDDPTVVALLAEGNLYDWLVNQQDTGVFIWENQNYEAAGAYVRIDETTAPLTLDALSHEARSAIGRVRFENRRFASTPSIQLADHLARDEVVTYDPDASLRPLTEPERADAAKKREKTIAASRGRATVALVVGTALVLVLVLFGWLTR